MKQASIPLYIRFGDIPEDNKSKIYLNDKIVGEEPGVSVWEAIESDGMYFPTLPKEPNANTIADYFRYLVKGEFDKVLLVTGDKLRVEGTDREPLLMNVKVIQDITGIYKMYKGIDLEEEFLT